MICDVAFLIIYFLDRVNYSLSFTIHPPVTVNAHSLILLTPRGHIYASMPLYSYYIHIPDMVQMTTYTVHILSHLVIIQNIQHKECIRYSF